MVISKGIDESKMGYRGSKSDQGQILSVKEQRADASSYVKICKVRSSRHESGS
jgi:hypothetical protein